MDFKAIGTAVGLVLMFSSAAFAQDKAPAPEAAKAPPAAGCGDGELTDDEECDDGNKVGGDGCTETCEAEATGEPEEAPEAPAK